MNDRFLLKEASARQEFLEEVKFPLLPYIQLLQVFELPFHYLFRKASRRTVSPSLTSKLKN